VILPPLVFPDQTLEFFQPAQGIFNKNLHLYFTLLPRAQPHHIPSPKIHEVYKYLQNLLKFLFYEKQTHFVQQSVCGMQSFN